MRPKRTGRQRGAWVYLDADLIRRAGVDPESEWEVVRYAMPDKRRGKGRAQIVLKLRPVEGSA